MTPPPDPGQAVAGDLRGGDGAARPPLRPLRPRHWSGLVIFAAGLAAAAWLAQQALRGADPRVVQALLASLVAAGATALGALPALVQPRPGQRTHDMLLGFGAGVMLAACAFSLVVPGIAAARAQGAPAWGASAIVGAGLLVGAVFLMVLDRWLVAGSAAAADEGSRERALRRAWLFVFAVALHNLPEGLAIGVAYAGNDATGAAALATGIAIQDVPEGLVIALALTGAGYRRTVAVALGAASGLVEPIGALAGAGIVAASASLLPWGLAFAAGAMLWVISHEIIPESHRRGHQSWATAGLVGGFVLMMMLDTALT